MGYDDRVSKNAKDTKPPQLQGHTKTYTKVVLDQNEECLAGQPAEALIGKCVKVKITVAHKWHISGYIVDASPAPERAPVDYFERQEALRKQALIRSLEDSAAPQAPKFIDLADFKTRVHLAGMLLQAFGVYYLLRQLF